MHTPPPPFLFLFLFLFFDFYSVFLLFLFIFPYFSFSLFHFFYLFLFQGCGLPGILKLRSVTFLLTKIDSLYLDFCSYLKKTKKNQEIANSEISSKTPLLQTSEKLTKLPLLETSKIEEIAEKKVVRNFLTNLNFFIFFEFFSENVLKTLLRGRETTRKKY